ncbi:MULTISPECIES: LysR family transcriptional regulator [unclassified Bradyrhizobium]|uniref:LysR family transcriptional regulator n=1 Tax=unclassified Bradyrhizobium TaxID=2631580 RepID=UPI001FF8C8DF|nr:MULTISPECIES: LysR family transcriptional regulator [unclassified Bradyrhizobium]MCK1710425.1 LysR family transcriptional regulator [Bradyrhizobium sp. 143]MCK1728277.1 LysR family transcriptional regulator [Bradyrhizobium sp. 142]
MSKLKQLTDLDLKLLRVFVTIVDQGSFTAAQAQLNISQSVLSENLKSLEIRLGMRLCERGPGGFLVLPEGHEVYRGAKQLFAAVEDFKTDLAQIGDGLSGELTVALEDDVLTNPNSRIAEALHAFSRTHGRRVRIKIEIMAGFQVISRVADGTAQIGLTVARTRVRGVRRLPLFFESRHLYCAQGHPIFEVREDDITEAEIVRYDYSSRGHLEPDGFAPVGHFSDTGDVGLGAQAHLALVLSGRNVGFVPDHVAKPYVERRVLRCVRPDLTRVEDDVVAVSRVKYQGLAMIVRLLEHLAEAHGRSLDQIEEH